MITLKVSKEEAALILEALDGYNDMGTIDYPYQSEQLEQLGKAIHERVDEALAEARQRTPRIDDCPHAWGSHVARNG